MKHLAAILVLAGAASATPLQGPVLRDKVPYLTDGLYSVTAHPDGKMEIQRDLSGEEYLQVRESLNITADDFEYPDDDDPESKPAHLRRDQSYTGYFLGMDPFKSLAQHFLESAHKPSVAIGPTIPALISSHECKKPLLDPTEWRKSREMLNYKCDKFHPLLKLRMAQFAITGQAIAVACTQVHPNWWKDPYQEPHVAGCHSKEYNWWDRWMNQQCGGLNTGYATMKDWSKQYARLIYGQDDFSVFMFCGQGTVYNHLIPGSGPWA